MAHGDGKIDAYMWSWRVYSIHDDYVSKRPEGEQDHLAVIKDRPKSGDTLTVRLGDLPPGYYDTKKQVNASLNAFLGGPFNSAEDVFDARDKFIDKTASELALEPIPGKTWLTLELRRAVRLTDNAGSRYLWNDMKECEPLLEGFQEDRRSAFDATAASIATDRPEWLDHPQREPERTYIGADGKGPTFVPSFKAGIPTVSVQREWAELPGDALDKAAKFANKLLRPLDRKIVDPASWLTAARRESDDPFRRFMFACFGLEMLATNFERTKRRKAVEQLEAAAGTPLAELIWPRPNDSSRDPARNTMFNFAIMAVALSSDPRKDIDAFRPILDKRNRVAHGSSVDIHTLPADETEALLQRYLGLVTQDKFRE